MMQGRIVAFRLWLALGALLFAGTGAPIAQVSAGGSDADAPWAALRAQMPGGVPVYRPTTLPARFRQATPEYANGTFLGVSYLNSADDYLQFSIGGANSAAPTRAEPIAVHGYPGFLTFSDGSPPIGVNWQEAGQSYGIRGGRNVTRAEMLQVAESLAPVGADGGFAPQCFAATGKCASGRLFAHWLAHGGLAVNGYPISDEFDQQLEDGRTYRVQYFERVRLELHPDNAAPYDVLLGQFGRRILATVPGAPTAPVPPQPGSTHFPETGHNVGARFLAFWESNGGLAQFGYPLTEPFAQQLEDGNTYTVQYFERGRLELHPGNAPPHDVLLGQFGRQILAQGSR